jgi:predicted RNA-binding protein with PUA-like domain
MTTWMLKSEPETYSYDQLVKDKKTAWTGVRNYTARIHLNAMKKGDRAFFYHSGGPKEVVAVVEIVKEAYADATATDPEDAKKGWVCVDIKPIEKLPRAITLAELKKHKTLSQMQLVKMSRLSVSPVSEAEAKALLSLAGK